MHIIQNANAIADLAIQNFKEMRDLVGQEEFLENKKIEHQLTELYPQHFKSQYELVTFSTSDYKYAKAMGAKNNEIISLIKKRGLSKNLEKADEVLEIIDKVYQQKV